MNKKTFIPISLVLTLSVLLSLLVFNNSLDKANRKLQQHSQVIANALWILDTDSPLEYLRLATEHEMYRHLWVEEKNGNIFFEVDGPELSKLDQLLHKIKLLPVIPLETNIFFNDRIIGKLRVLYQPGTIYISFLIFLFLFLLYYAFLGAFRTISAKKLLESKVQERTHELAKTNIALRKSERELIEFSDAMTTFSGRIDLQGRLTWVNQSAALTLKQDKEELADTPFHLYPWWAYSTAAQDRAEKAVQDAISGKEVKYEEKIRVLDDQFIWVYLSIQPVFDSRKQVKYLIAEGRDITDLKAVTDAHKKSEDNLRITLDSIGDAVIATNENGIITRMNPVAEQLTGYSLAEAVGMKLDTVFSIKEINSGQLLPNPFTTIMEQGKTIDTGKSTALVSKIGDEHLIAQSGTLIQNEQEQVLGVVLVFRDITEQNRIEGELRQSQKMDSIGMLAGGIAHDFNNILAGIMGYSELLHSHLDDPKLRSYSDHITTSASRAADLTSKLLAFSRKGKIQSTSMNTHDIIEEVYLLLERTIDKKIELLVELTASNPTIIGDPSELQSTFLNLGINARDAMPNGGSLTFTTNNTTLNQAYCDANSFHIEPGEYLEICIRDTGTGIDKTTINSIFEPFFTTKEVGKGTGLGLAAVYGTIKDHQGAISVFSEPGQGTAFYIYIPSAEPGHEVKKVDQTASNTAINGKVLIIDDEDIIRSMSYDFLSDLGYTVLLAEDGEQGTAIYQKEFQSIDVVVLDMVMPKLSGKECFERIRAIDPEAKVILSSGFSENTSVAQLKEQGAFGFIKKPYNFSELHATLSTAIREQNNSRKVEE